MVIQHWRPYWLGRKFLVHTDQRSLRYLLEQRITMPNQQSWIAKLLGYDFEIVCKSGVTNKVVNALSQKEEDYKEEEKAMKVMVRPYQEVLREVEDDETLMKIIKDIKDSCFSNGERQAALQGEISVISQISLDPQTRWWVSHNQY